MHRGKELPSLVFLLSALKRSERQVFHDGCSRFTSRLEESAANQHPNSQPAKSRPIRSLTPRMWGVGGIFFSSCTNNSDAFVMKETISFFCFASDSHSKRYFYLSPTSSSPDAFCSLKTVELSLLLLLLLLPSCLFLLASEASVPPPRRESSEKKQIAPQPSSFALLFLSGCTVPLSPG